MTCGPVGHEGTVPGDPHRVSVGDQGIAQVPTGEGVAGAGGYGERIGAFHIHEDGCGVDGAAIGIQRNGERRLYGRSLLDRRGLFNQPW